MTLHSHRTITIGQLERQRALGGHERTVGVVSIARAAGRDAGYAVGPHPGLSLGCGPAEGVTA